MTPSLPTSQYLDDLLILCPAVVIWNPMTSRNNYGAPIYAGTAVAYYGRRDFKFSRVASYERGTKGQGPENISESQIIILGTPNVQYEDQVYLQGDAAPYPPILSVQLKSDENGPLYTKVFLGSSNG